MFFGTFGAPREKIRSAERYIVDTLCPLWGGPFLQFYFVFLHFRTLERAPRERKQTLHGGHFISPVGGGAFLHFYLVFLHFRTLERGIDRAKYDGES